MGICTAAGIPLPGPGWESRMQLLPMASSPDGLISARYACDNRCQPAHFRIRKDCLIFPHSNDHKRPGTAPLRPEGVGLPPRLSPALGFSKASL